MKRKNTQKFPCDPHGSLYAPGIVFRRLYPVIFIILTGSILYSDSLRNSFHFDDISAIISNMSIRDIHSVGAIWNFDYHSRMRFVGYLTFALNYHFGQLDVFGYHLVNILIHIAASLCAWWLALLLLSSPVMRTRSMYNHRNFIAFGCGLIFAAHPVQTQAVTYIVQRFESLAAFFTLASLCCYMQARRTEKRATAVLLFSLSLLSAFLGMFTKETTFILPFLVIFIEIGFNRTTGLRAFFSNRQTVKLLLAIAPVVAVIPILYLSQYELNQLFITTPSDRFGDPPLTSWIYLITQFRVFFRYILRLFVPVNQNLDYDFPASRSFFEFQTFASFVFLTAIVIAALLSFRRRRLEAFGILWFFLAQLVASSVKPLKNVIFEHRLYLPMFGYGLFLTGMLYHIVWRRNRNAAVAIFVGILSFYSVATYQRNKVWRDDYTLWKDTVTKSPARARPHNNLGNALYLQGRYDEALVEYRAALRINPSYGESFNNIGSILSMQGKYDEAIGFFRKAIEQNPGDWELRINYGNALFLSGRIDEALEELRYITMYTLNINGHINLGEVLYAIGRYEEAAESFRKALLIDPENPEVHTKLGNALLKMGKVDNAVNEYMKTLELAPDSPKTYYNLGVVNHIRGNRDEAVEYLRKALRIDPNYDRAKEYLDKILDENGAAKR